MQVQGIECQNVLTDGKGKILIKGKAVKTKANSKVKERAKTSVAAQQFGKGQPLRKYLRGSTVVLLAELGTTGHNPAVTSCRDQTMVSGIGFLWLTGTT